MLVGAGALRHPSPYLRSGSRGEKSVLRPSIQADQSRPRFGDSPLVVEVVWEFAQPAEQRRKGEDHEATVRGVRRTAHAVPGGLRAAEKAGEESGEKSKIDDAYQQIHEHVCTELGVMRCPPTLSDDEKWAFVKTWCARRPQEAEEAACMELPVIGGPVVIAFDHDGRAWRPIDGVDERDIDADANGVPKVLTKSGRSVIAVVESTTPWSTRLKRVLSRRRMRRW